MANVKVDIDAEKILRSRGMGSSTEAQRLLADTIERLCKPYVPMGAGSQGHVSERVTIAQDGSTITWAGPYAQFLYRGIVMVGVHTGSAYAKLGEPKRVTGTALQYHGGARRGKEWDKRMMADRGEEVRKAVAKKVGGK